MLVFLFSQWNFTTLGIGSISPVPVITNWEHRVLHVFFQRYLEVHNLQKLREICKGPDRPANRARWTADVCCECAGYSLSQHPSLVLWWLVWATFRYHCVSPWMAADAPVPLLWAGWMQARSGQKQCSCISIVPS